MNVSGIVMVVVILTIVSVVPIVLIGIVSRRRPAIVPGLQECPYCGARNPKAREHCYCCGFSFIISQSNGLDAALIQRVK
jgi:hypothetical protein